MNKQWSFMYYRFQFNYQGGTTMFQEQVIEKLQTELEAKGVDTFCYSLRHSCLQEENPVFLLSTIKPDVMDVLIFEIQRRYAETTDEETETIITHSEIAGILISEGVAESVVDTHIPESISGYRSFDLFDNIEIWEASAERIESLPVIESFDWEKIQERLYSIGLNKTE